MAGIDNQGGPSWDMTQEWDCSRGRGFQSHSQGLCFGETMTPYTLCFCMFDGICSVSFMPLTFFY